VAASAGEARWFTGLALRARSANLAGSSGKGLAEASGDLSSTGKY
jgi:hypothetical protein